MRPVLSLGHGKWVDRSGYNNSGAVHGAHPIEVAPDVWGYEFDGVDDYVNCGGDSSLTSIQTQITLLAFVLHKSAGYGAVISYYGRYEIHINSASTFIFQTNSSGGAVRGYISSPKVSVGKIQLLAFTYNYDLSPHHQLFIDDNSYATGWINGNDDSNQSDGGLYDASGNLYIGKRNSSGLNFHGIIISPTIIPTALTLVQIREYMYNHPVYRKLMRGARAKGKQILTPKGFRE